MPQDGCNVTIQPFADGNLREMRFSLTDSLAWRSWTIPTAPPPVPMAWRKRRTGRFTFQIAKKGKIWRVFCRK